MIRKRPWDSDSDSFCTAVVRLGQLSCDPGIITYKYGTTDIDQGARESAQYEYNNGSILS